MRAPNGNHVDIEAKAKDALDSGCNFLVVDLKCGATVGLISIPNDADTGKPVFAMEDGE